MDNKEKFREVISSGYTFSGDSIILGTSILNGEILENNQVKAPLKTFNRHGLIAGATGTGKTKTLQVICEKLADKGVSILAMDIKGDLSGISQAGDPNNTKATERAQKIGVEWKPLGTPTELMSISDEKGVRLRATISEFGPVLLSRILDLNDTQSGVLSLVFKYADDKSLPLLDIKDLRKVLQYVTAEGKAEIESAYGSVSPASVGTILRQLIALEEQGADKFFGEKSFEVEDLLRKDDNGRGYVNIIRLVDLQTKPRLFSTFMLCLLAEIYQKFPERGDADMPELVIFIDEAHLIFDQASKALLEEITAMVKLIRSKGVGLFFVTQTPTDIPNEVLGQLGMKVQHALRAFTAVDRKAIKLTAENYPETEFYKTEDLLTQMGIGEALITVLNEKGIPTPLAHTLLCPPQSRMDVLSPIEMDALVDKSSLAREYNQDIDRESAFEILTKKLEESKNQQQAEEQAKQEAKEQKKASEEPSMIEEAINSRAGQTIIKEVTRGLLGVLGLSTSTRRKKSGWF
ncbi:ATPase [Solitalea longa]|uniref:ATPase n=1 Tax=Solitalea longa TaxID=2079460 RepID=A0A2S5A364_9SPHI|nr:helicase HerA-like domain-containing protein [Solitalea longa]POY37018.1 ATPase [Solitalea longa]